MDKLCGWITPSGKYLKCAPWKHVEDSHKYPELVALVPDWDEKQEYVKSVELSCQETADRAGDVHAEWHCYEMANSVFECHIAVWLYRAGAVRISDDGVWLHCETLTWTDITKKACRKLADDFGYKLKADTVTWVKTEEELKEEARKEEIANTVWVKVKNG